MMKEKVAMKYQFDLMRVSIIQALNLKGGKSWRKPVYHKKKEPYRPDKCGDIGKSNFVNACKRYHLPIGVVLA
jgi:hypothetical protein